MLNGSFQSGFSQITLSTSSWLPSNNLGVTVKWINPVAALFGPLGLIPNSGAAIIFNLGGFEGFPDPNAIREGAVTLIHELGHAYNLLPGSGGSDFVYDGLFAPSYQVGNQTVSASDFNDDKINKNCTK
jgi:hypothetical protein